MCWAVCRWCYIHSDLGFHRHTVPYPTAGLSAHTDRLRTLHTSPLKWVGVLDKPQPSHKTSGDTLPTTGIAQWDNCHMPEGPCGTNRNLELTNNDYCLTADSTIRLLPRHRLTAGLLPFSGPYRRLTLRLLSIRRLTMTGSSHSSDSHCLASCPVLDSRATRHTR
jgi:hypothetical protein